MSQLIKIKCFNVMGMPTDEAVCSICGEKEVLWGKDTLSRLEAWGVDHLHEKHADISEKKQ